MKSSNKDLVSDELFDLLGRMLVVDHSERISAPDAINHAFFDEVRKPILEADNQL